MDLHLKQINAIDSLCTCSYSRQMKQDDMKCLELKQVGKQEEVAFLQIILSPTCAAAGHGSGHKDSRLPTKKASPETRISAFLDLVWSARLADIIL